MYLKPLLYVLGVVLVYSKCVVIGQSLSGDNFDDKDIVNASVQESPDRTDFQNATTPINIFSKEPEIHQTESSTKNDITTDHPVTENLEVTYITTTTSPQNTTKTKHKKKAKTKGSVGTSSSSTTPRATTTTTTQRASTVKLNTKDASVNVTPEPINSTISQSTSSPKTTETPLKPSSFWASFNLKYLYFLLLLIPIIGIVIGIVCFCKRRKKGYTEPTVIRGNKTRRFSTPSWVFSDPHYSDEEIETLQEEKK